MRSATSEEPISSICVDASFVVRLVVENPLSDRAEALFGGWLEDQRPIAAPALLFAEVANALYRYEKATYLSAATVAGCLDAALALPISLYSDLSLHRQALRIASEGRLRAAYDPHYVALAEALEAELWTADSKMINALEARECRFRLLK